MSEIDFGLTFLLRQTTKEDKICIRARRSSGSFAYSLILKVPGDLITMGSDYNVFALLIFVEVTKFLHELSLAFQRCHVRVL